MRPWQLPYLGLREIPGDLSEFEIQFFFGISLIARRAIHSRYKALLRLGAALQLGFLKMAGRPLGAFQVVPRALLEYLGGQLEIDAPELSSLHALYHRRRTLFEHQRWACQYLGFKSLEQPTEARLLDVLQRFADQGATFEHLLNAAKGWLYDNRVLIPGTRRLRDLVRVATAHSEQVTYEAVCARVPETVRAGWVAALSQPVKGRQSLLEWLQRPPAKHSPKAIGEALARRCAFRQLGVDAFEISALPLERQRVYARRLMSRRPVRLLTLREPRRPCRGS